MSVLRIETGGGHRYQTPDGQPVPGVTTILGKALPKPALVPWAANTAAGYAVDNWDALAALPVSERIDRIKKEWRGVRDRAAARGTRVHAYGEALVAGTEVEVPGELLPYVEPYVQFLADWDVRPVHVEAVVWSDDPMYAGTLDLIADVHGRRLLLDLKTTGSGVWPESGVQASAYRFADWIETRDGPVEMPDVDGCAIVWLPGDGTYHLIPVESGPDIYRVFEAACRVAAWSGRRKSDLIGRPLSPPVQSVQEVLTA